VEGTVGEGQGSIKVTPAVGAFLPFDNDKVDTLDGFQNREGHMISGDLLLIFPHSTFWERSEMEWIPRNSRESVPERKSFCTFWWPTHLERSL